jgi:transcriptional regulator with XRE-family HTH domain
MGMNNKTGKQNNSEEQESQAKDDLARRIGRNVREIRKGLHLSLKQLAEKTGVSPALLSRIENGLIMSSIGTLQVLSNYLKVDIAYLFRQEEERGFVVTRAGKRRLVKSNRGPYGIEPLAEGMENPFMDPCIVTTLAGDGDEFNLVQHDGQEFCYVLEGKLGLMLGERNLVLNHGDAAYFLGEIPHGGRSLGKRPARTLHVHLIPGSRLGTFEMAD